MIHVDSVEEAVAHARALRRENPALIFRGQRKNWPVVSSFLRLDERGREDCLEQLGRFQHWINLTPGLEALRDATDEKIAIAQHYGIPTNFIDFSTKPEIAAFFATEQAESDNGGEDACIICLDPDDLLRMWSGMMPDQTPPELLRFEVDNLWRMQAQHGLFLFNPYKNLDTHFYDMDRIFFPLTHRFLGVKRDDIYPSRKSQLEILIDQFFMNEKMLAFDESHISNFRTVNVQVEWDDSDREVYPKGIPDHSSWKFEENQGWLSPKPEKYFSAISQEVVRIRIDSELPLEVSASVADQIINEIVEFPEMRHKLVVWEVDADNSLLYPEAFSTDLASKLNRLWDGIRGLPYSAHDLAASLGTMAGYGVALQGDFANVSGRHWEEASEALLGETLFVEFGADDGSYSRGHVSVNTIQSALRDDLREFVSEQYLTANIVHPVNVLRMARVPQQIFKAEEFFSVFVREIVPTQVLMRSQAVYYSPVRLTQFGLA